ncbi:MAG: hypothetical protein ACE5GE_09860 [Phycisphaerae bacterium]
MLPRRAVRLWAAMAALLAGTCSGCIEGSLATSSGPSLWSARKQQQVHVGETVRFDFILVGRFQKRLLDPYGLADYVMAQIGEHRVQCEPDLGGHFQFEHRFSGVRPGQQIEVTVTAYRQHGNRDFIQAGKHWLRGDSSVDEPDPKVCQARITLEFYQARLEATLPGGGSPLEPESGKLRLFGRNDRVSSVFVDRPNRRGFALSGPDASGNYTLVYEPDGDEIDPSGQTEARFIIYDLAGQQHTFELTLATP